MDHPKTPTPKTPTTRRPQPVNGHAVKTPDIIAIRKSCDAEGTGLSHFVLMDKEAAK
jgi:modified peptide precursor CbpA